MINFETVKIDDKIYISSFETDEELVFIPEETSDKKEIYGIDSFAFVGQEIKKVVIFGNIQDIRENAFFDCFRLEEVKFVSRPEQPINLDKAFKKEVKNILFLTEFDNYDNDFITNDYMIMKYNNVLNFATCEETDTEIFIKSFPIIEDLYFPDNYKGKDVSLKELDMEIIESKWSVAPKKIRFPKNGFSTLISVKDLKEICYSPLATYITLPKCSPERIVMYDKVETIFSAFVDFRKLKTFVVEDSISSLKNFDVESIRLSPWYNSIEPKEDGTISFNGLLLYLPKTIMNTTYKMPKDIVFIPNGMFKNSKLKEIVFNNKIKNISRYCFRSCLELKDVFIPKNISFIGEGAFMEEHFEGKYLKNVTFEDEKSIDIEQAAFDYEEILPFM